MKKIILAMLVLLGLASFSVTTNVQAAVDSNSMGSPNIKIDGNFDDWKDKPITDVKEPWDNYNIKHESLLADQDNIYFYLDMSPVQGNGYLDIQPSGYKLTVGDKKFDITIKDDPYILDGNTPKKVHLWIYEEDGVGNVNMLSKKAEAYAARVPINVGQGYTEKLEFKLPLSELGITGTTSQEITMKNANLGTQTLHVKGGSTGPVVLAVSGFAIALLAVIKMPKINELRKSLHE
ncbi:Firmicu-CTERM sorting domain-containing protein [Companilactobacillus muriivasis]|uniref:Firmicu-CTERM sorting domain-containing protein n=1 Tax=Companilactobacillus muriivasis TaxID=3081444 RepID=UPI0030C67EB2